MSLTAEQHAARQRGIGGSDAAVVLGVSKWKTARELFHEKRGELTRDYTETDNQKWGRLLEPIVRQEYAEQTRRVVRLPPKTLWHPKYTFMCCHPDGVTDPENRLYEGKTAEFGDDWGEEGSDQIPLDYTLQVQHNMAVMDVEVCDLAVLISRRRFRIFEIKADPELQQMIIEGEAEFAARIEANDPPPLNFAHRTAGDLVKRLYPGTTGEVLTATDDLIALRASLEQATEQEKAAKAVKEECRARLQFAMGEAALLNFPDGKSFRRQLAKRAGYVVEPTEYIDCRWINTPGVKRK